MEKWWNLEGARKELKLRVWCRFEMSGAPVAFREMIDNMYNGSKIALLGILPNSTTVDWNEIIFKALTLKGIYGREMWKPWYKMQQMLLTGLIFLPWLHTGSLSTISSRDSDVMESGQCGKSYSELGLETHYNYYMFHF